MSTHLRTTCPPAAKAPEVVPNSLGYDFALLGLAARECRVNTIRKAARQTAKRIHNTSSAGEHHLMLSHLAISTYRLLDPRRRNHNVERIYLSLVTDEDWDRQRLSRLDFQQHVDRSEAKSLKEDVAPKYQSLVTAELVEPYHEAFN